MRTNGWRAVGPTGLPEIDSIHRLELVAVVDDRVGHDLALPPQPEAIHLAHGLPATDRADSPGRKVHLPAVPAFRADEVVAARDLAPEPGNRQVSPPSRRGGPPQWRPSPRACA